MLELRGICLVSAFALGAACLAGCAGGTAERPAAVASKDGGCPKIVAPLAEALRTEADATPVPVVVELSNAPRARDLLQTGLADCVASPSLSGAGSWSGNLPWDEEAMQLSSDLPVFCVGWATRRQIVGWCSDPTVRSVERWQ
jgi:hypothetical protein